MVGDGDGLSKMLREARLALKTGGRWKISGRWEVGGTFQTIHLE